MPIFQVEKYRRVRTVYRVEAESEDKARTAVISKQGEPAESHDGVELLNSSDTFDGIDCIELPPDVPAVLIVRITAPTSQIGGVDDYGDLMDLISSVTSGYFAGSVTWAKE